MNNELEILKDVSSKLNKLNLPFMLTGSFAISHYAEPRMTRALDIVIQLSFLSIKKFEEEFKKDYYVSAEMIEEAVKNLFLFNIIHYGSNIKIDFIIRKNSEYRENEFERRQKIKMGDFETWIVSIEDLIISKIESIKITDSTVQRRDIKKLLSSNHDHSYLNYWLRKLDLIEIFESIK